MKDLEATEIESRLKAIDYLYDVSVVRIGFGERIIGFNAFASSLIRKAATLRRIEKEIIEKKLPLEVDDHLGSHYAAFRLMIKN